MGVRPPANDDDGEGELVTFGIAALDARFEDADVTFPADAEEVVRALGDPDVEYDPQGHTVALSTALSEVPVDRFESRRELMNALHPVFERYRQNGGGLLEWFRSVFGG